MVANVRQVEVPSRDWMEGLAAWDRDVLLAFKHGCRRFYQRRHRRGRKSSLWLNILIRECVRRKRAEARTFTYFGPTFKQTKRIIWTEPNMLFKWLPPRHLVPWKRNESELLIEFPNGCILQLVGLDDPDNARGTDPWGCVFDEWAIMRPESWHVVSPIIAENPERWAAFIFTPDGQNHAFEMDEQIHGRANDAESLAPGLSGKSDLWGEGGDWFYEHLTAPETGLIPQAALEKERQNLPTAVFDQEYMCSYITDEEMVLISSAMLDRLRGVEREEPPKRIISCDPAMGGDTCVLLAFTGTRVVERRDIHSRLEGEIIGELLALGQAHQCDDYIIDADGLGQPIASRLAETGKRVQEFRAASKTSNPHRWRHLKDEAWWYARQEVSACRVVYPDDLDIRRQVSSVKYSRFDASGVLNLEPKTKTKETLGRSPDHADAWVMGLWGLRGVELEPQTYDPRRRKPRRGATVDPMAL